MRVLFAPDKFKGSLSAGEAAAIMARGWRAAWPEAETVMHPLADGGDGSLDVLAAVLGGEWRETPARDARGVIRPVRWLWQPADRTALIETARVAGLAGLSADERRPATATSAGLGDLIHAAERENARRIFVCLGGSATNDAGCGLAAALGFRFLDREGDEVEPLPVSLPRVAKIAPPLTPTRAEVIALADVRNPLLGPEGSSRAYGPQKGADPAEVDFLEDALRHTADLARRDLGAPDPATPGAGAAGGLGFGFMTFLGGCVRPGFETIARLTKLPEALELCDLVVTGEGRLDAQTASGKAPAGVAALARAAGKPVIAIVGSAEAAAGRDTFDAVYPLVGQSFDLADALRHADVRLERTAAAASRSVKAGASSPAPVGSAMRGQQTTRLRS